MRIVLQRVAHAQVQVDGETVGKIDKGILIYVGVTHEDTEEQAHHLAEKCLNLRIFENAEGKRNQLSVLDISGEVLVVSQFTLYGDCRKGRRPSFDQAAPPEQAEIVYHRFVELLKPSSLTIQTGRFQAMMEVESINDGPVTFVLEK